MTKKRVQQIALPANFEIIGKKYLTFFLVLLLGVLYLSLKGGVYQSPAQTLSGRPPYALSDPQKPTSRENNDLIRTLAQTTGGTTDTTGSANNKVDELISDRYLTQLGLQSCAVEKVGGNFQRSGRNNIVTTASLEIPSFAWVNSDDPKGTQSSPWTPPCIVDLREDFSGTANWTKNYAVSGGIKFGGQMMSLPVDANGAVCIYNDFRAYGLQPLIKPTDFVRQYSVQYKTKSERDSAKKNLFEKFFGGIIRKKSDPSLYQYNVNKCSGNERIDTIYNGDTLASAQEVVVKPEQGDIQGELEQIVLPLLGAGMATSYRELAYEMNWAGYGNLRVIGRNRTGIKVTVTLKHYEDRNIAALKPGDNYTEKGNLVGEEKYEVYFPFGDYSRRAAGYLTNYFSDFGSASNIRSYNYYGTYNAAISRINANDLNASIGASGKKPFATIDSLLKDTSNLFYCADIDGLKSKLEQAYKDNTEAQALIRQINRTDCIDTSFTGEIDPTQQYLCDKGYLKGSLCANVKGGDPTTGEPALICKPNDYNNDIPNDFPLNNNGNNTGNNTANSTGNDVTVSSGNFANPVRTGYKTQGYSLTHPGIDWGVKVGTPVFTVAGGTVLYAGVATGASKQQLGLYASPNGGYGNVVMVQHGSYCSVYAHLNSINVNRGQVLGTGQQIGLSGSTGNSSGPHLHFELRKRCDGNINYEHSSFASQSTQFVDPTCFFAGNCQLNIPVTPTTPIPVVEAPQPEICTINPDITPVPIDPGTTTGGTVDFAALKEKILNVCKSPAQADALDSVTTSKSIIELSSSTRTNQGTFGANNIFELIERVANQTCVPQAKLASHLHIEYYGASDSKASADIRNIYNGKSDQTALKEPNICGCVGVGQFCPTTASTYYHPNGSRYNDVYECVVKASGMQYQYGQVLNPAYVGVSICGMATFLKAASGTGDTQCQAWVDAAQCAQNDRDFIRNSGQCPNRRATQSYFGSCVRSGGDAYCRNTAPGGVVYDTYLERL